MLEAMPRLRKSVRQLRRWFRRGQKSPRHGKTLSFDVIQKDNTVNIQGDGIEIYFSVEGNLTLPAEIDATFAVWALLPRAMEEGFDIYINRPIDRIVADNAKILSQIWEMWECGCHELICSRAASIQR
jgi:hypothetical protein